ncbi:hypothetical protein TPHA_0L00390 [Tetrapisispora phaffii CBS 4417]|uniref:Uncharacterized protein n=1 Tax=Tetrapisispora phaffii (strain ATCC 24235 / CBS 4417 / NBRC 1672 / NRRL Y-8282 / UCD 70-5) TaxID=1071381 RepID=G8BZR7_TETPH|nr:hypothetical protein TPHA_0L00390 [Tetrapisispora phaffii CBS 4417]CCE65395.1 hypothetical protein TPHA_0L00390 [Tetrapisispora phaffii CBS 4417]
MPCTIATLTVANNVLLPLRIHVNRKQLLQNIANSSSDEKDPIFEAPLLANNSIIQLKAPLTRIYLSNKDLTDLCNEIKYDLLFIVYDLTSKEVMDHDLRIGKVISFQNDIVEKHYMKDGEMVNDMIKNCHIESIVRISKFKLKISYKHNWELSIFIKSLKQLTEIRNYLLFKNFPTHFDEISTEHMVNTGMVSVKNNKRILLTTVQEQAPENPVILLEGSDNESGFIHEHITEDTKPTINYKYQPSITLPECIEIHVLKRPRRHRA